MCLRRNNLNLTTTLDPNISRNDSIGMEHEAGHHHHLSLVTAIVFFSSNLFIPLSLKIPIRDGFHEILH
ncbi:hypothetical protein N665_3010s0002 [Sinapis alba]|nr:hypothetical protein N665_3010s0002 [Sinapis alba]